MIQQKVMTVRQRQRNFYTYVQKQSKLLLNKGNDYTAGKKDEDAYTNFRWIADLLEGAPITPYTVALIYQLKHIFSLITFAKTGKQESGEGLEGRHLDVSNYVFILNELVNDHLNWFEEHQDVKEPAKLRHSEDTGPIQQMDDPGPSDEDFSTPHVDRFDLPTEFVKVKDKHGNWVSLDEFFRKEEREREDLWP